MRSAAARFDEPSTVAQCSMHRCSPYRSCSCSARGLDAIPLVGMAAELGWFVTVADHRPGLPRARRLRARRARGARRARRGSRRRLPLDDFDAIVVMSHHLATDRKYLARARARRQRAISACSDRARAATGCSRSSPKWRRGFASGSRSRGPRHRRRFARVDRALDSRRAPSDVQHSVGRGRVAVDELRASTSCRGGCRRTS